MFIKLSFALSLILFFIAWSLAYINLADFGERLVIHFDSFRGADFVGTKTDVFKILAIGSLLLFVNWILSGIFYRRERFLSYTFAGVSIFAAALILIQIIVIININL